MHGTIKSSGSEPQTQAEPTANVERRRRPQISRNNVCDQHRKLGACQPGSRQIRPNNGGSKRPLPDKRQDRHLIFVLSHPRTTRRQRTAKKTTTTTTEPSSGPQRMMKRAESAASSKCLSVRRGQALPLRILAVCLRVDIDLFAHFQQIPLKKYGRIKKSPLDARPSGTSPGVGPLQHTRPNRRIPSRRQNHVQQSSLTNSE